MLESILDLFRVRYPYRNAIETQRANTTVAVALLMIISGLLILFVMVLPSVIGLRELVIVELGGVFLIVPGILAILLAHQGRATLGAILIASSLLLLGASTTVFGPFSRIYLLLLMLPIVITSLLLNWQGTLLAVGFTVLLVVHNVLSNLSDEITASDYSEALIGMVAICLIIVMIGTILALLSYSLQRLARRSVQTLDQMQQLDQQALKISRTSEAEAAQALLTLIHKTLNVPYAQIFLTRADGSIQMGLSQQGWITANVQDEQVVREVRIQGKTLLIGRDEDMLMRSHLKPGAEAGLLLPIQIEEDWFGVLDVQGSVNQMTRSETRALLEMLARRLAANLRQQRSLRAIEAENAALQSTISQQRARLLQLEQRQQRETNQRWIDYLQQRSSGALGFDFSVAEGLHLADNLPPELAAKLESDGLQLTQEGDQQRVSVPVRLRDQSLGVLSFRLPAGRRLTQREAELIQGSVQRLALEMENKLLFQQAQSQALRERQANEIASTLLASTDVQTVVQLAAERFMDILGAVQTQISLEPEAPQSAAPPLASFVEEGR